MKTRQETPAWIVRDGKVTAWGAFATPFRNLNLIDADIFGTGAWEPAFFRSLRLKRWQHFAVINERFFAGFVTLSTHYLSTSFCYVYNRETREFVEHHAEKPGQSIPIAKELWNDHCLFEKRGYRIEVQNRLEAGYHRALIDIAGTKDKPGIKAELEMLEDLETIEPLIVVLPLGENRPLHTHKAPCPVRGTITLGDETVTLEESKDLVIIDVQKTFYPYSTFWKWATFAGRNEQGKLLGINLVNNMIKNDDEYNENCLWVDGKLSFFGPARFTFDEKDPTKPWEVKTTDGRCDLQFVPQGQRAERINMGLVVSDYYQPYGLWSGRVVDDNGVEHEFKDIFGVTENHLARF
jgi:Domain of unknown function (DUF2804), C-terminal/Domain of unknown function (DUF2804), N-terminal